MLRMSTPWTDPSLSHFSTIRITTLTLLFALVCSEMACVRAIRHDPDSAAIKGVEFARTAIIEGDYPSAYQQLSRKGQQELTVEKLQDLIIRMHPKNWPRSIAAIEYEPLPGREAMNIFLFAKDGNENFVYMFVMDGTADTGYKVSGIVRRQTPLATSSTRRPLPIQRTTNQNPDGAQ